MRTCFTGLVLSLALLGCAPNDDAGDVAFVSRAVPAVLGRKVHGARELNVLTQLVENYGRETLVELLMRQPEYVQYWSTVLADDLEVQYGDSAAFYGQSALCFDFANVVAVDDPVAAQDLNDFLTHATIPTSAYSSPFSMLDALHASILADDLTGVYKAWLFPMGSHINNDEGNGARFFNSAYLGRDRDCLSCHSSTWSTTDDVDGWDRFAPVPIDVEGGLYQKAIDLDPSSCTVDSSGDCTGDRGCCQFQTICATCHNADGGQVMGVEPENGDDKILAQRVRVLPDATLYAVIEHGTGNMDDPNVTPGEEVYIVDYLRRTYGSVDVTSSFFRPSTLSPRDSYQPLGMANSCTSPVNPLETTGVHPDPTYWPQLDGVAYSSPSVFDLSSALTNGAFVGSTAYINGANLSYATPSYGAELLDGPGNLAFGLAQHIVDNVLDELEGERHTVGHGFERNEDASLDRNLRAMALMDNHFSLRYLVKSVVLSETFNRRSPEDSFVTSNAYTLTMALNPWAAVAPGEQTGAHQENANSQGDLVHRYTPDNLYWSVHHGLGWNAPDIIPLSSAFPNYQLREQIGDFTGYYQRGTSRWSLSGPLYWESAVGLCSVSNAASGSDWVTLLLDEAYLSPSTVTIEDLVVATRDRLLGSPELIPGEEAELLTMLTTLGFPSYPNLAVPLTSHPQPTMDAVVRTYCGGLLTTPDYLLAGLPGVETPPLEWPALQVCLPDEPCSMADLCAYWTDALDDLGLTWTTCDAGGPPQIVGQDPDAWDAMTVEDSAALAYGYSSETAYDEEVAQAQEDELDRLAWEDSATLASAQERAYIEEQRRDLGHQQSCGGACDGVASSWSALLADEADARANREAIEAAQSLLEPAPRWQNEPYLTLGDWRAAQAWAAHADELPSSPYDPSNPVCALDDWGACTPIEDP